MSKRRTLDKMPKWLLKVKKRDFKNFGKPWTKKLILQLERLFLEGMSIAKIAIKMDRSPNAIKKQLEALNLIKN
tara:strand:- start:153 stop:374 length:222 start_codon:yes stop_codon:yes gene_type:complete